MSASDIPDTDISDEEAEEIEEAGEGLAEASANTSSRLKWAARGVWTALVVGVIAALALAIHFGYIDPNLTFNATVNVGYIVEGILLTVGAVIIVGLVTVLLIAMPGSFISAMTTFLVSVGQALSEE